MPQAGVAQQQVHIAKSHGGQAAQLVVPGHAAALQHDFALTKQPVRRAAVALVVAAQVQRQTGDPQSAVWRALYPQLGRHDRDLVSPQPQE